jgi:pimeloyl-ACP methyl ester carboxylesterase
MRSFTRHLALRAARAGYADLPGGTPMMDSIRRALLKTAGAATAMASAPRVFAQQSGPDGASKGVSMGFYQRGDVRIHFEEAGSGFPLLLIAGGGLNSTISALTGSSPFNPIEEFKGEYRCIASDLRNANTGESSGPLEIERPWDAYTDDHLGLMDHLGIDKFMVLGFCIGGPLIWNLLKRAPDRVVAAVLAQPSGSRPEMRDLFYEGNMKGWGPELVKRRPDITMETVDQFLTRMYRSDPDFVLTVTRDFVRHCQTPVLILPDDIPAHPYAVAMEAAMLAPNAEVSMFPWKEPKERIPLAVRQIRSFLRAHRPTSA